MDRDPKRIWTYWTSVPEPYVFGPLGSGFRIQNCEDLDLDSSFNNKINCNFYCFATSPVYGSGSVSKCHGSGTLIGTYDLKNTKTMFLIDLESLMEVRPRRNTRHFSLDISPTINFTNWVSIWIQIYVIRNQNKFLTGDILKCLINMVYKPI